jgi:hypothetical protein
MFLLFLAPLFSKQILIYQFHDNPPPPPRSSQWWPRFSDRMDGHDEANRLFAILQTRLKIKLRNPMAHTVCQLDCDNLTVHLNRCLQVKSASPLCRQRPRRLGSSLHHNRPGLQPATVQMSKFTERKHFHLMPLNMQFSVRLITKLLP